MTTNYLPSVWRGRDESERRSEIEAESARELMDRNEALKTLGLPPTATSSQIKEAYRDLAKIWHPDRFGSDPRLRTKVEETLKQINEAYQFLQTGRGSRQGTPTGPSTHASSATRQSDTRTRSETERQPSSSPPPTDWTHHLSDQVSSWTALLVFVLVIVIALIGLSQLPQNDRAFACRGVEQIADYLPGMSPNLTDDTMVRRLRLIAEQSPRGSGLERAARNGIEAIEKKSVMDRTVAVNTLARSLRDLISTCQLNSSTVDPIAKPFEVAEVTPTGTADLMDVILERFRGENVPKSPPPPSVRTACTIDQSIRPRSGAEIGGRHRGGLGRLRIDNGTDSDAVAVLVADHDGAPRRAIFIRAGEVGVITSVPSERYRLRFQRGLGWLPQRRFCRPSGTSEFDEPFDFSEVVSEQGTQYATFKVTLHPVAAGTARTHRLPDVLFELPPL